MPSKPNVQYCPGLKLMAVSGLTLIIIRSSVISLRSTSEALGNTTCLRAIFLSQSFLPIRYTRGPTGEAKQ